MNTAQPLPRFGVVLVNYKTPEMTKITLELLQKALVGYEAEVWVVDNYSADESTTYLRSLDWIHLLERPDLGRERGFEAHGRALDLVFEQIKCDYLFLLHTDTLIYDAEVFSMMLRRCLADPKVFLVGCLEQIDRGRLRSGWRLCTRYLKHHVRRLKLAAGLKSREPKPYQEQHVKSFCALWNLKLLRQHGLSFMMAERVPGYEAQDQLMAAGYKRDLLSPSRIFKYLDHVEAGTISAIGGYDMNHRRFRKYREIMAKRAG